MKTRKSLLLALAAAGFASTASAPSAQFASVFVPELALIDAAMCRQPGVAGAPALVRLVQASQKKTEISPAAPDAAQAVTASKADAEPALLQGLGTRTIRITTASKSARQYFDQGYRLAWGFNHAEALRAFRKAQQLDPQCAMCFWGEAWALGPNINVPMDDKANTPALAALDRARRLALRASPREQALIEALATRYSAATDDDRAELNKAYAHAMRETARRFGKEPEVLLLYADALMNVSPWDYWQGGGKKPKEAVADLVPTLERILQRDSNHAAAIHLYIHAVEASDDPRRAERYADKLAKLAPGAGHLVHMPSHIYFVLGRYKDSFRTNVAAVKVDEAYIAEQKPTGVYPLGYYPHNVHFVMVSAQMAGDGKAVLESAEKLSRLIPSEAARAVLMLQPVKAAPYFAHAQFSDLGTVMALPEPGRALPYIQTAWRYARGVALVRAGDASAAAHELAEIERIARATDYKAFEALRIPAKEVGADRHARAARPHRAGRRRSRRRRT